MRFSRIDSPLSGLRQSWLDFSGLSPNGSKFDYSPRGSASKQVPQIRVINNSRWFASKYGKAFWINSPFRQASKSLSTTRTKFWELHILQLIAKHVSNFGATGTSKLMLSRGFCYGSSTSALGCLRVPNLELYPDTPHRLRLIVVKSPHRLTYPSE